MTHTTFRFLATRLLATLVAPLPVALCALGAVALHPASARAQLTDPGFGDPTKLTQESGAALFGAGAANGGPSPTGYPNAGPLPPTVAVRPAGWPGGGPPPQPQATPAAHMAAAMPAWNTSLKKSPADPPFDPAEIMARIGTERIQACEVLPMINRAINKAVGGNEQFIKMPPEEQQAVIQKVQKQYMQQALQEVIRTKLLVAELRNTADEKMLKENEKNIRDFFNTQHIHELRKEYNASSIIDLEDKLRALGGSIESQRRLFIEQSLAMGWLNQQVRVVEKEPTHDEMLTYYREHIATWETPARARWEQITAKWTNFNTRDEARAALARWGDDVFVRRVPFAEVARAHSQDFAADDGGLHDWASKGSLLSEKIDAALFSLPIGQLSQIIEDDEGCHIIRVVEREDIKRASFVEVQPEIKKQLNEGGAFERRQEYIEELKERIPVWTVFDVEKENTSSDSRYTR